MVVLVSEAGKGERDIISSALQGALWLYREGVPCHGEVGEGQE